MPRVLLLALENGACQQTAATPKEGKRGAKKGRGAGRKEMAAAEGSGSARPEQ
ncbi:hypothetical protein ACLOJK_039341 [Asimina triloba]